MKEFLTQLPDDLDGFYLINAEPNLKYYTCNSLLINNFIIDTGFSNRYLRTITDEIGIATVFFTHWHEDHIAGSSYLNDCQFICHVADKDVIEDITLMYKRYGHDQSIPEDLQGYLNLYQLYNTRISRTVKDSDIIKIGDEFSLKVIHAPGHAAGHCCLYDEKRKFAFLSDINMEGSGPWYGGRDSSLIEYVNSLEKLLSLNIERAAFSHYGYTSSAREVKAVLNDAINYIKKRDELLLSHFSEQRPITSNELWKKGLIYEGTGSYEMPLILSEKIMIENHFEKFLRDGLIEQLQEGYILR